MWSGHQKLTGITAPRSGSDHLMVDGHYSDQQNRPEQKIFRVAPQFLYRKKSRDHCGSRAKAATELFIGRVTRFVLRRCLTPPRARPTATRLLPLDAHYRRLGYPQYAQHKVAVIYKYYQIPVVPPPWPLHRIGLLQARTQRHEQWSEQWNLIPYLLHTTSRGLVVNASINPEQRQLCLQNKSMRVTARKITFVPQRRDVSIIL